MLLNGNLTVLGQVKDLKVENLASDPLVGDLVESRVWYNTVDKALKFFDGTTVHTLAVGGSLDDYIRHDGTVAMTGALQLNNTDQSAEADNVAVSKGHLDTELAKKANNLTGAASTVAYADLSASVAVVSDASGKIVDGGATATEVSYLSGVTGPVQTQIDGKEPTIGYVPVNKAGDSMSGNLAMNNNTISGLPSPTDATEPVRLVDLEAYSMGFSFQEDVLAVQTDATLDPTATPTEGDRYLITDAAALHANFGTITGIENNDIVEHDGTEFVVVYDASVDGEGALTWDRTSNVFMHLADGGSWAPFGGLSGVTAGIGLAKDGNTISVNMGAGVAQLPTDEVGIDVKVDGGLITTLDGTTTSTDTAAQLAILLNGSSLALSNSGLTVNNSGVTEAHLNGSVAGNGLQGGDGTSLSVQTAVASGITVDATGVSVDDTEMRNRVLYRDGAEAMTGELTLSSADQSASADTVAASAGYVRSLAGTANQDIIDLNTRVDNGTFVYEELTTPATTHTVPHNLGNKYASVTVVDAADEIIMPDSITYTDANSLVVVFSEAITCRVVVVGTKAQA